MTSRMKVDLDSVKALNRSEAKTLLISILIGLVVAPLILSLPVVVKSVHDQVDRRAMQAKVPQLPEEQPFLVLPVGP